MSWGTVFFELPFVLLHIVMRARALRSRSVPKALEMVRALLEGQETVLRTARQVLQTADAADDPATADLVTQRLQLHEKSAWMLRGLLED